MADGIAHDVRDLVVAVAERLQGFRHAAVDDLEVPAARELLEFHQREIGLDAGGVAIHQEPDRAGRRDHGRLRVAEAIGLAQAERLVPGRLRGLGQRLVRDRRVIERNRRGRQALIARLLAVRGAAVIADHAQHRVAVLVEAREGAELARHLGRRRIGHAGQDRGDRARDRAALAQRVPTRLRSSCSTSSERRLLERECRSSRWRRRRTI